MILNVLILFLSQFIFQVTQGKITFRKDYTYIEEFDSFYKIHTLHKTLNEAITACERESATLFFPEEDSEALAVIDTYWKNTQIFLHWIIVNAHKSNIINSEGIPVLGVFANWHKGEPNNAGGNEDCVVLSDRATLNDENCNKKFPFICKKTNKTIQWNEECRVPYSGYKFDKTEGKCYKFHSTPRNWIDAYAICYGEESSLAVVDDEDKAAHLVKIMSSSNMKTGETIHSGFFNRDGWRTIEGVPLHEIGYNNWAQFQPDGWISEDCGAMTIDGYLHDSDCSLKKYFICEHKVVNE